MPAKPFNPLRLCLEDQGPLNGVGDLLLYEDEIRSVEGDGG